MNPSNIKKQASLYSVEATKSCGPAFPGQKQAMKKASELFSLKLSRIQSVLSMAAPHYLHTHVNKSPLAFKCSAADIKVLFAPASFPLIDIFWSWIKIQSCQKQNLIMHRELQNCLHVWCYHECAVRNTVNECIWLLRFYFGYNGCTSALRESNLANLSFWMKWNVKTSWRWKSEFVGTALPLNYYFNWLRENTI